MANSMITGVSGLQSHQKMIEIVGNNLANLNTVGYKERTGVFADVLYETLRGGSSGTAGVSGGTNPVQVGTGSRLSSIRSNMTAGGMESTGSDLDLALDGDGFFVVNNGTSNLYTRAGTFQIDKNGLLVDSGTGYPVQRFGIVGESNEEFPSFQTAGDASINIPLGANVPGRATQNVNINGNLPSAGAIPTAGVLSTSAWLSGGSAATSSSLLNSLDFVTTPYQAGDSITISGTDTDGSAVSVSVPVSATTTVGDLMAALNSAIPGTTTTISSTGALSLTANDAGKSYLSVALLDGTGNTGGSDFTEAPFVVSQTGVDGAVVRGGVQVYDLTGGVHTINYQFAKKADGTWDMTASLDPTQGTMIDSTVTGITFGANGAFSHSTGTGNGDANMTIQFAGQSAPLTFNIVLDGGGTTGSGLNSFSGDASISSKQDGYANGTLTSVQVDSSGIIQGVASNGTQFPIAQLAIGNFRNPQGLEAVGNNFYNSSLSSGDVQLGSAGASGNGVVRAGQLEQSNVDIAVEFTRLIVAQRGFSANARTITVTNDVLQELTNLIR
ncbi:flagellar hook protein FlgE [Planctomicrobium piriforme]|uniref:Flagellar hook protein FlgE n=1 Tax=Planctomicrobium piriforme TaxID=1576369 RepID=A0A1I3HN05_9PLAN|nr:flagellar hook-basal body complex protein [Planctomicrobium piriforme]SFI36967.1 flagellar hook protein FlgE [Planctomicrobium piriforme]